MAQQRFSSLSKSDLGPFRVLIALRSLINTLKSRHFKYPALKKICSNISPCFLHHKSCNLVQSIILQALIASGKYQCSCHSLRCIKLLNTEQMWMCKCMLLTPVILFTHTHTQKKTCGWGLVINMILYWGDFFWGETHNNQCKLHNRITFSSN